MNSSISEKHEKSIQSSQSSSLAIDFENDAAEVMQKLLGVNNKDSQLKRVGGGNYQQVKDCSIKSVKYVGEISNSATRLLWMGWAGANILIWVGVAIINTNSVKKSGLLELYRAVLILLAFVSIPFYGIVNLAALRTSRHLVNRQRSTEEGVVWWLYVVALLLPLALNTIGLYETVIGDYEHIVCSRSIVYSKGVELSLLMIFSYFIGAVIGITLRIIQLGTGEWSSIIEFLGYLLLARGIFLVIVGPIVTAFKVTDYMSGRVMKVEVEEKLNDGQLHTHKKVVISRENRVCSHQDGLDWIVNELEASSGGFVEVVTNADELITGLSKGRVVYVRTDLSAEQVVGAITDSIAMGYEVYLQSEDECGSCACVNAALCGVRVVIDPTKPRSRQHSV